MNIISNYSIKHYSSSGDKGIWEPSPEMIIELYKKLGEGHLHIEWVGKINMIYFQHIFIMFNIFDFDCKQR